MDISKWINDIIKADERFSLPIMTHPGIELIGSSIRQAVQDGNVHARAIKALNERFPAVALTTMMDLTVEAEAFGCAITFPENDMPHIVGRLMDSVSVEMDSFDSLSVVMCSISDLRLYHSVVSMVEVCSPLQERWNLFSLCSHLTVLLIIGG